MMTDDALHGHTVLSSDGHALGEVTHLLIDRGKLEVAALEVKLRRNVAERLHLATSRLRSTTITIPADSVHSIGDVVILEVGLDSLAAPAAPGEQEPVRH